MKHVVCALLQSVRQVLAAGLLPDWLVPSPPLVPPPVPVLPLLQPAKRARAVKDEIVRLVSVITLRLSGDPDFRHQGAFFSHCSKQ
ncbi:MAG: hypothetical protein JWP87_6105 [Labilithrix sp.]|nr:hypothetical protein [Labilithrix sp.]